MKIGSVTVGIILKQLIVFRKIMEENSKQNGFDIGTTFRGV